MALFEGVSGKGSLPPRLDKVGEAALGFIQSRVRHIADKVVSYLQSITPVRSGFLRSNACYWGLRIYGRGGFVFWFGWRRRDFYSQKDFYAPYVDQGTGVYGIRGYPIVPRNAARLVWQYHGRWVSAPYVLGQRPQNLLRKAKEFALREVGAAMAAGMDFGFRTEFYKK